MPAPRGPARPPDLLPGQLLEVGEPQVWSGQMVPWELDGDRLDPETTADPLWWYFSHLLGKGQPLPIPELPKGV